MWRKLLPLGPKYWWQPKQPLFNPFLVQPGFILSFLPFTQETVGYFPGMRYWSLASLKLPGRSSKCEHGRQSEDSRQRAELISVIRLLLPTIVHTRPMNHCLFTRRIPWGWRGFSESSCLFFLLTKWPFSWVLYVPTAGERSNQTADFLLYNHSYIYYVAACLASPHVKMARDECVRPAVM